MTKPEQIVVIEDDSSMSQAIQRLLSAAGYRSLSFASAEAFLESGASAEVDCYVIDIHMPGLSGLDLWRQLLACGVRRPVVFITASDDPSTQAEATACGATACLLKPFAGRTLLAAIRQALDGLLGSASIPT